MGNIFLKKWTHSAPVYTAGLFSYLQVTFTRFFPGFTTLIWNHSRRHARLLAARHATATGLRLVAGRFLISRFVTMSLHFGPTPLRPLKQAQVWCRESLSRTTGPMRSHGNPLTACEFSLFFAIFPRFLVIFLSFCFWLDIFHLILLIHYDLCPVDSCLNLLSALDSRNGVMSMRTSPHLRALLINNNPCGQQFS